jgi:shikimate kinase
MLPCHIFLIGYRGSGKTSVGKCLADRLRRPFVDTDLWIELHSQRSIPELFESDGEEAFRNWETTAIEQLPEYPPMVVSLGGGSILRAENRELLRQNGTIIWLRAAPRVLAERIAVDASRGLLRPSLTGDDPIIEIEQVLASREPLYRSSCDWELETADRTPSELALAIADWYADPRGQLQQKA